MASPILFLSSTFLDALWASFDPLHIQKVGLTCPFSYVRAYLIISYIPPISSTSESNPFFPLIVSDTSPLLPAPGQSMEGNLPTLGSFKGYLHGEDALRWTIYSPAKEEMLLPSSLRLLW